MERARSVVRRDYSVRDKKRCGARMVRDDSVRRSKIGRNRTGAVLSGYYIIWNPGQFDRFPDQRSKQICVEVADFVFEDGGHAFEAHAGVDGRLRQGIELAASVAVELHEDEVPDFDIASAVAGKSAIGVALIGRRRAHVVENLAARAARAGVAHGPEILF